MTDDRVDPTFTSRPDLLEQQRIQVAELERRLTSPLAALRALGWLLLVLVLGLVPAAEKAGGARTVAVVVFVVAALVALWRLVVAERTGLRTAADLARWRMADRTRAGRDLPGDVPPELRTAYDARDAADLADVAGRRTTDARQAVLDTRPVLAGLVLTPAFVLGIVALAAGLDGNGWCLAVAGVVAIVVSLAWWTRLTRESWRRQQVANRAAWEGELYLRRQAARTGQEAAPPPPALPRWARPVAGAVVSLLVIFLVVRGFGSSLVALGVVVVLLVLAAVAVAVPLLRARATHVVPLLGPGPSVLEGPARAVTAVRDSAGVHLRPAQGAALDVPADEVLAVLPVALGYPFAPPAVGVVTQGEPFVVAGRGSDALLA